MHCPGSLSVLSHMVSVNFPRIKTHQRVRFKKLRQDYFQCQENSWIDRLRVGTSDEKANILNSSWLLLSSVSVYKDSGFGSQSQNSHWLWSGRVRSSDSSFTELTSLWLLRFKLWKEGAIFPGMDPGGLAYSSRKADHRWEQRKTARPSHFLPIAKFRVYLLRT